MSRCLTFRYVLQPTTRQRELFERLFRGQRELYNAALEERKGAWKWERRRVTYVDQCRTLTELRDLRPDILDWGVVACRGTLKRLDRAYSAFYRRCRTGEKPGYPRFRSVSRFDSVQYEDKGGWRVHEEQRRLYLMGVGHVKLNLHRPLRGTPKAITLKREGRRYFVSIRCTDVPTEPLPATGRSVGIDLGVKSLLATSDGELVREGRFFKQSARKLEEAQRSLATKKRGSNKRRVAVERVARCHRKIKNQRKDLAHKLSRRLVEDYDLIVHEDLKIRSMVKRPRPRPKEGGGFERNGSKAKTGLNRSVSDSGWGQLLQFLAYKAEGAGREVIAVDPRHSSQRCASCGHTEKANRVAQAEFRCLACGHEENADVNAATNILWAGRAQRAKARAGSN